MLSRCCDGCPSRKECEKRYVQVDGRLDRVIYCKDGSRMLID